MPAPELSITMLQLDTPVYANDGELAGHLRLIYAEDMPPYKIHSFVLDRGNLGGNVMVPIEAISDYSEGKGGQRLTLSISNDDISKCQEYISPLSRSGRESRSAQGNYNKRTHAARASSKGHTYRRATQER
ncbi:hypothetical protein IJT17_07290 [bacterium]|nr:hypothetical protein [bacterium]